MFYTFIKKYTYNVKTVQNRNTNLDRVLNDISIFSLRIVQIKEIGIEAGEALDLIPIQIS